MNGEPIGRWPARRVRRTKPATTCCTYPPIWCMRTRAPSVNRQWCCAWMDDGPPRVYRPIMTESHANTKHNQVRVFGTRRSTRAARCRASPARNRDRRLGGAVHHPVCANTERAHAPRQLRPGHLFEDDEVTTPVPEHTTIRVDDISVYRQALSAPPSAQQTSLRANHGNDRHVFILLRGGRREEAVLVVRYDAGKG